TYSMYNMESEAGVEMAFNAAKSTCKNGGGNDNKIKSCVKDTVMALPECDESREGLIEKKDSVSYVICKKGSWEDATETDVDTYGKKCTGTEVGTRTDGVVTKTNKYYCTSDGWISLMTWNWDLPKEAYLNPEFEYGTMTDSRDGQVYRTTTIGDQVWMAENLNYADSIATPSLLGKSWCFDNEEKKCNIAGRFYTWAAAIDSVKFATDENNPRNCGKGRKCNLSGTVQGICPNGWHLPSDGEFATLLKSVSKYGTLDAGYILKASPGGWINAKSQSLTDKFGFSALPVGDRSAGGDFSAGSFAFFWTTQEYDKDDVKTFELYSRSNAADWWDGHKYCAYSVRCVKDSE
ncbi:MAG: fibrobacter succinogenes major paralogous domain-containing protein, partial [Fibrobacter sp.]|uniref:fibrobacter succinogenes major paralogous domain-containing protein n=1 Tax=Fibrobacter sp. TaxID=35828 RepID=UPI002A90AE5E